MTWRRALIAGTTLIAAGMVAGYLLGGELEQIAWSYARGYSAGVLDEREQRK